MANYTSNIYITSARLADGYVDAWLESETDTTATIGWKIGCRQKSAALYGQEAYGYVDGSNVGYCSGYLSSSSPDWKEVCSKSGYTTVSKTSGARNVPVTVSTRVCIIDGYGSVTTDFFSATAYVPIEGITVYAPNAPSGLTNTRESDSKNVLSWTAPNTSTTKPVSAILIERSVDGGAWSQIASVSASATSYNDATTSADHSYQYRICSQNSAGKSDYVTSQTTYNTPAAPTKVTASRLTETTVKLEIENPAHTAQGAQIERSTNGATWEWVANVQGAPVTETTDEPGGGAFFYRVRNTRDGQDGGMLVSGWSPVSNVVVTIREPAAPTLKSPVSGSVIKKSQETITFKWAHNPVDGSAQTAAELAYSTDGGNTWTTVSVTTAQQKSIANDFDINTQITWRVRTKGAHADYGPWSSTRVFRVYQEPSVAFTAPSDGFTIENTPIHVALQYDDPSGTLANASLSIAEGAKVVYTRDMGTDTTCDIQATEWLPDDGVEYTLTVYVRSSSSLTASAIRVVTVDFDLPTPAVLGITPDPETGYVSLLVDVPSRFSDASGDPVHVTDALEGAKVEKLTVNGNSYQVVTTGKNLMAYPYSHTTQTTNGITFTDNGDGTVKASGTATAAAYFNLNVGSNTVVVPAGCYIASVSEESTGVYLSLNKMVDGSSVAIKTNIATQYAFELTEETELRLFLSVVSGRTIDNATLYPMLEAVSSVIDTATEWEPYSGGMASPCPDYPQPITMLGSRNLLNYPYYQTTRTNNGITFTDNGDGTITANGTATAVASFYTGHTTNQPTPLDDGRYVLSGCPSGGGSGAYWVYAIDGESNTIATDYGDGAAFDSEGGICAVGIRIANGTTVSNLTFKPMIRPAACEEDEWVPYGKVKVEARGKNLLTLAAEKTNAGVAFTPDEAKGGVLNGTATASLWAVLGSATLVEGETYTLSASKDVRINIWDSANNVGTSIYKYEGAKAKTFIAPSSRLTFCACNETGTTFSNAPLFLQLESSSEATPYVPYAEPLTALIDMQGEEVRALPDGTRDELTVDGEGNVSLVRNVGAVTYDDSESWMLNESVECLFYRRLKSGRRVDGAKNTILCDKYKTAQVGNFVMPDNSTKLHLIASTGYAYVYVKDTRFATTAEWTAHLAEEPLTFYYPLETPEVIDLGTVELTDLPAPDFTLEADASLPATLDLTYTNGMEPASSVSVYRSYDGERVLIAEGLQQGAGVVDRYAPLNVDYQYEAVTFADSGALNSNGFGSRVNTPWWFVYFAEGMAKAMWEPSGSRSSRRTKDELKERDGSKWPVLIQGKNLSHKVDFSGWVETKEEADAFEDMTLASGCKVYKGLKGEVFHCHAEADITDSYEYGDDSADVKVAITRVRGGAL